MTVDSVSAGRRPSPRSVLPPIRRARVVAVTLLAVAGVLLAGCSAAPPARPVAAVGSAAAAPAPARPQTAVVIGDSIAFGKGVLPGEAWPARVAHAHHWQLTDLAVSGSGFVRAGWNGTTYRQQVDAALRLHPDYVLIAATRNDRDEDPAQVEGRADAMLTELRTAFPHTRIIGITAVWGSDEPPASITRVDRILDRAVTAVHGTFIDIGFPLVGRQQYLQPDGIHPNAAGEDVVARVIESKLAPLDLAL